MVACLYDVVYVDALGGDAYGVGLEDLARLVMCKSAPLYVVRVVGKVYLCAMIDAPCQTHLFLLAQYLEQW